LWVSPLLYAQRVAAFVLVCRGLIAACARSTFVRFDDGILQLSA
jgi:hypothetical protein